MISTDFFLVIDRCIHTISNFGGKFSIELKYTIERKNNVLKYERYISYCP